MATNAVAVLRGEPDIKGTIYFTQEKASSPVHITGEISGLTPGEHGFHIHQFGDTTNGCISAGPHFNIDSSNHHGGPTSTKRHNGDLGNVVANEQGVAKIDIKDSKISLVCGNELDIKGRSLVLHKDRDDLGMGGNEESLKTGNAGGRIACAIIGRAK